MILFLSKSDNKILHFTSGLFNSGRKKTALCVTKSKSTNLRLGWNHKTNRDVLLLEADIQTRHRLDEKTSCLYVAQ